MPGPYGGKTVAADYYSWLEDISDWNGLSKHYTKLLFALSAIDFNDHFGMDMNRSKEGMRLFDIFCDEHNITGNRPMFGLPNRCSMLELMVHMATVMNNQLADPFDYEDLTGKYFWEDIIRNLKLNALDDVFYERDYQVWKRRFDDIISNFNSRSYDYYGNGSMFPMPNAKGDMRNLDVWDQMQEYIMSYYPL